MHDVFHNRSMQFMLGRGPGGPAHEAVDCVAALRLVEWKLVALPVELVAAILQPVRPRDQHLTPTRGAHLVSSVSVDKLAAACGVGAEATTNLDDNGLLISSYDRDLLARWCDHRSPPVGSTVWPTCLTEGARGQAKMITSH